MVGLLGGVEGDREGGEEGAEKRKSILTTMTVTVLGDHGTSTGIGVRALCGTNGPTVQRTVWRGRSLSVWSAVA
jgi:hypothetical protein